MKGRVLVIHDEAVVRRKVASGLTQAGYDVTACPDGVCAIQELVSAREKEGLYTHLVTGIFLPDICGLEILKAARIRYPNLPALVVTRFGNEALKAAVLSERNAAYFDEPVEISDLVQALGELSPGTAAGQADSQTRESAGSYLAIRITEPSQSKEIFKELHGMNGVERCDAVRGDFDMIVVARGDSRKEIEQRIGALRGAEIVFSSEVALHKFDPETDRFFRACSRKIKARGAEETDRQIGRASYLFVDIDKNELPRIFMTVFFASEVVFCDVIDDGARLIGKIAEQGAVGATPRIIEKLGRIDGVRRVREAAILQLT